LATDPRQTRPRAIRLDLEYDGTDFRGFAPQPGSRTVGGELESVLSRVCGEAIRVQPGGRTDSGVHALGQVASFRTENTIAASELKRALNALLATDVYVKGVGDAAEDFDARRSAQTRRYRYAIWNAPERNIWHRRWMGHVVTPLDVERMQEACQALVGKHDFAAFRTHKSQDPPGLGTVRQVHAAAWARDPGQPDVLTFTIEADAYLRHMVRAIVGSAILVGEGKLPGGAIGQMLERKERAAAGPTAPANGLTLLEVTYGPEGRNE
jgi:tRNA pseudouridine38-40 synthase